MPNQLSIPFKKTYAVPITQAARDYLQERTDTHPDAFKWDINRWETLRKSGVGGVVHVNQIDGALRYHAQLLLILTKLPSDINLEVSYLPVFSASELPITLRSLTFERAAVLFNLAALYSQLGAAEDRANHEGVKRASAYYQSAAGTLAYLISSAIPKLAFPPDTEDLPTDLSECFLKSLEWLMLAQAQECVWQKAVVDNYKNGLIAKLATQVASFYRSSLSAIVEGSAHVKHILPANWIAHIESKRYHFDAAAQYRKSIDELEANRYGLELGRLGQARADAKKGYDIARRGGVASAVFDDVKNLLDTVQKNISRAERDNDLIYHQDVPTASAFPPINAVSMVNSVVPPGLQDPKVALANEAVIFGELLGWGAREAIKIFTHNKDTLIKERIADPAIELDDEAHEALHALNLPAALEALERPIGLPPSLLRKAEEVRLEDGPSRIDTCIEDAQRLAQHDTDLLSEAMDVLDNEASEDEAARKDKRISRPPSHEANQELVAKGQRYRQVLEQAAESDEIVRQKWDEWEKNILELTWDEAELEASVPSTTVSPSGRLNSNGGQTQTHARALRVLLESLDDLIRSRAQLVERAQRLAEAIDIQPRITQAAAGIERWVEAQPVMFEDISDSELSKFDNFISEIAQGSKKQEEILNNIRSRNELYLQSRRDDPSVKEREHALQSLDLAYHKYREITRNLDEGLKFYNDLAGILTQFRESCKTWSYQRKQEIHALSQPFIARESADASNISPPKKQKSSTSQPPTLTSPGPARTQKKSAMVLPSLHSDEWESFELPPGPQPTKVAHRMK